MEELITGTLLAIILVSPIGGSILLMLILLAISSVLGESMNWLWIFMITTVVIACYIAWCETKTKE